MAMGFLVIGAALFFFARWKTGRWETWPLWLAGTCVALGAVCWLAPAFARPVYAAWHAIGALVGFCVGNLLLILVFYLLITPIGLIMRMLGRDPLERKWDPEASTYWKVAEKPVDAKSYFRQF